MRTYLQAYHILLDKGCGTGLAKVQKILDQVFITLAMLLITLQRVVKYPLQK